MLGELKWIFFDLGSTLIDETEADDRQIREMTAGTAITAEEYCRKRLEMIESGRSGDAAIEFFGLTKAPWHSEEERPYPDAAPVLSELRRRGYKLGVIANQNPGTKSRLDRWGLSSYFDVIVASAEAGTAKPDPAIFIIALSQANCLAADSAMVGDRLDNDVAPSKRLGMRSIRLLRGLGALHKPQCSDEIPEYTVSTLADLLELF